MARQVRLGVIGGDGIGPEVVGEALKVLDAVAPSHDVAFDTSEYDLGAGEATLDLRPLAGGGRTVDVEARLGLGDLVVLVPADVDLDLDATIGLGQLRLTGPGGTDRSEGGAGITRSELLEGDGGRRVELRINVGAGEVEVRRVRAQ